VTWRLSPALVVLRSEINAAYPTRSKVSDGSIGDAAHSSRTSDHNPDPAGWVRAIDVTEWDPGTPAIEGDDVAEALAEHLRRSKDPRIKYVIWRGRMFSSYVSNGRPAWTWRKYTGANGHFHHAHVSVLPGASGLSPAPWGFSRPGTVKPPEPDPNAGRPWKQFAAGATDLMLYRAKGARNDEVAELEILLGNRVDQSYSGQDVLDVVALKKAAMWVDDDGHTDRSSVVTARFMDALRHLAGGK